LAAQISPSSLMPRITGDCDRMMTPPSCFRRWIAARTLSV